MKSKTSKIYGSGGPLDLFFRLRAGNADLSGIDIHDQVADNEETHPRFERLMKEKIQNQLRDYEVYDRDSGATEIITATPEDITGEATEWLREGYENEVGQGYAKVSWVDLITGGEDSTECLVGQEPDPPECETEEDHEWRSPHSVVGGLEENPGVWALRGTETMSKEVCLHCGIAKALQVSIRNTRSITNTKIRTKSVWLMSEPIKKKRKNRNQPESLSPGEGSLTGNDPEERWLEWKQ